jgi:hypothetical protein
MFVACTVSLVCAACAPGNDGTLDRDETPPSEIACGDPATTEEPNRIIYLTSLEDVVDQVTCAGSARLHAWCAKDGRAADDVALRVIHPLHPDTFVDVSCERVLAQECTGTSASPLEVDGPLGEAAQPATPLALGCFLAATAIGTLGTFTCLRHPKDKNCGPNLWGSGIAMGAVCLLF